MFSSFGWGEFLFIMIIGLIVIGPERLPSVIEDVRAAIYAARTSSITLGLSLIHI